MHHGILDNDVSSYASNILLSQVFSKYRRCIKKVYQQSDFVEQIPNNFNGFHTCVCKLPQTTRS